VNRLPLASAALLALASAASAADLPRRAAPPTFVAAAPVFTWTGFYVGVHGAWIRNDSDAVRAEADLPADFVPARVGLYEDGFGGGGQIGYLVQFGSIVAGLEADITAADIERTRTITLTPGPVVDTRVSSEMKYFGTVKGRLGLTFPSFLSFFQQTMVYVTGGLGYADVEHRAQIAVGAGGFSDGQTIDGTRLGFVVGGGTENAITNNISLKTETVYYNLEDETVTLRSGGDRARYRFENDGWISKIGLNIRF
jgi:outer membrane immunogenic protein